MGENESPIPIIFSFDDFGFYFVTKGTNLGDIDSSYNPSNSPSCKAEPFSYLFLRNMVMQLKQMIPSFLILKVKIF